MNKKVKNVMALQAELDHRAAIEKLAEKMIIEGKFEKAKELLYTLDDDKVRNLMEECPDEEITETYFYQDELNREHSVDKLVTEYLIDEKFDEAISLLKSMEDEKVIKALAVSKFDDREIITFTSNGMTKKSLLKDFVVQRYSKPIMFIKLKDNDEVVDVLMDPYNEVFIATKKGYGLWYDRSEIPLIGLKTAGVKAINLKDDNVASACVFDGAFEYVTVITHKGLAKRIKLSEFEKTTRAKRGLLLLREVKSNPQEILKTYVSDAKKMIVLVSDNDTKEIKLTEIPIMDRYSTGSTITKKKLDNVYEVSHLTKDDVTNKKEVTKSVTKEEAKEKKEVSLKEIDDKFMTIDDFLDNFS